MYQSVATITIVVLLFSLFDANIHLKYTKAFYLVYPKHLRNSDKIFVFDFQVEVHQNLNAKISSACVILLVTLVKWLHL